MTIYKSSKKAARNSSGRSCCEAKPPPAPRAAQGQTGREPTCRPAHSHRPVGCGGRRRHRPTTSTPIAAHRGRGQRVQAKASLPRACRGKQPGTPSHKRNARQETRRWLRGRARWPREAKRPGNPSQLALAARTGTAWWPHRSGAHSAGRACGRPGDERRRQLQCPLTPPLGFCNAVRRARASAASVGSGTSASASRIL